ncbi:MAG: YdcF family protein [Patescibacteria group bacterium]
MKKVHVCIGCGVHENGETSNMNKEMVDLALLQNPAKIILCGGNKNLNSVTEAESMLQYALYKYPAFKDRFIVENKSYRTHNNALEVMDIVSMRFPEYKTVAIIDHPLHIERTALSFEAVFRAKYRFWNFELEKIPTRAVYDSYVYGQEYWVSEKTFRERERKMSIFYKTLLFKPWTRFGLSILEKYWPSEKQ